MSILSIVLGPVMILLSLQYAQDSQRSGSMTPLLMASNLGMMVESHSISASSLHCGISTRSRVGGSSLVTTAR